MLRPALSRYCRVSWEKGLQTMLQLQKTKQYDVHSL